MAFYKHLNELRDTKELDEEALIINLEEVPMVFDTVPKTTLNMRGVKDVREQQEEKRSCTLLYWPSALLVSFSQQWLSSKGSATQTTLTDQKDGLCVSTTKHG